FLDNLVPEVYTPAQGGGLRPMPTPSPARLTPYPFLHLLSNGKVFQAQSGFNGGTVDKLSRLFDPFAPGWSALQSTVFPHATGSSVLLANDVVMMIGGFANSSVPSNGVETMNPLAVSPEWNTAIDQMKIPRAYHTATLLPDGKVLVTGGVGCKGRINIVTFDDGIPDCSDGKVLSPELFDPQTGKWTTMNKHSEVRAYHSVAALLPDGRVLVGGGGLPGAVGETTTSGLITNVDDPHARLFGHSNVEIFSPPYLFDANGNLAARPTITSTPPAAVTYGETFFLGTSGAGSEPKVSFVRLPSVTHGTNQDQRIVFAQAVVTSGGIDVTVPASAHELPPGHYMVFVLNGGVPSEAAIIRVQNSTLFPTATAPTTTASGSGNIGEHGIEFSSSASGQITHLRFWKAAGEPSTNHVGRIWSASGTQLVSVAFTSETASGWQEVILPAPLSITAHTRYRVSYNAQSIVSQTPSAFPHPLTRGPLVTWSARYSSSAGVFPTTVRTSNPFVDVKFK
ncbi:MAG TPA: DUF4082 domain-containing protein, partial [Pyrinomonadaceae bacterium]|nr:DUF4082 domain-containing protein [Pyrinomonadaceae bacterium]